MQNLNKKLNSLSYYKVKKNKSGKRKIFKIFFVLIIIFLAIFLPLQFAKSGFDEVQMHSRAVASAYSSQNFGQIQSEVSAMKVALIKTNISLMPLLWMKLIPIIGGYYSDAKKFVSAGVEELTAFEVLLKELRTKEKELGFKGQPISGPERISQAIKIVDETIPHLPKVENKLKKAHDEVLDINVDKYPESLSGFPIMSGLRTAKGFITGMYLAATQHREALTLAPSALGQPTAKNYLMLFQNDKEIRPTGGFLTAYATLKLNQGQVETTTSDDIYRLDERLLTTCLTKICPLSPPAPIVKYLPEADGKPRKAWSMRDSNLSADVPTSAKEFERMYHLLGSGLPFDGIIYIDTQVVEELIEITGPIEVFGTKFSAQIDKRCDCPGVIYELESYAEIAAKGTQDRKAILGILMQQILTKLVSADVEKIPFFIETVVRLANHKHIIFYLHDNQTHSALSSLNWTGEIKEYEGDYLHINDSNFAGGKSNLYVEQTVIQDVRVKGNKVSKKITIEYKNPRSFNIWLNGINRDYVRFYVPLGSKLISSKGSESEVTTIDELGKSVFEAFITVRPENSRKLEIEYEIPYSPEENYQLLIQKQPGAKDFRYIIKINGSEKKDFKLDQDKEFKFDI